MKKHYNKYIKVFIPQLAFDHLHYKLWVNPPDFEYQIESFYSILNDLSNVKYFNDYTDNNAMIPLYSVLLQKKYGNNYNLYIRYLVNNSIIASSKYYREDNCFYYSLILNEHIDDLLDREYYKSSYCLNNYDSNTIQLIDINNVIKSRKRVKNMGIVIAKIPITCKAGKYMSSQYNKSSDRVKHYPVHVKALEKHFRTTIGIKYDDAMDFILQQYKTEIKLALDSQELRDAATIRYNHRIRCIIEISEGKKHLRFERNRTNRRIDTNLTNMAKELRPFLIGFEKLSYLDLSNSQPVLFNIMLNQYDTKRRLALKAEIEEYKASTLSGHWYELLMELYGIDRNTAKDYWMQIAYSKNKSYRRQKNKFAKRFPEIMKIIEKKKETDHAKFAIGLQKIESEIFIDEICKELVEKNIMAYTLHDGLLVPKEKEQETYEIMSCVLRKHLGEVPVISINDNKIYPKVY